MHGQTIRYLGTPVYSSKHFESGAFEEMLQSDLSRLRYLPGVQFGFADLIDALRDCGNI